MPKPILSLRDIILPYIKLESSARPISFDMYKGEIICLLGPNGSGKSTLLKSILGYYNAKGEILLNGTNIAKLSVKSRAKIISYVPQSHQLAFPYSVFDVVLMGRFSHAPFLYAQADKDIATQALNTLKIAHLANQTYSLLSGGQKQLVLIARALAQNSEIILLDEPVSALDLSHCFGLLEILKGLNKSIILTSHHPEQCFIAHKVAMIRQGALVCFDTTNKALVESNINALYGIDTISTKLPNGGVYFCENLA